MKELADKIDEAIDNGIQVDLLRGAAKNWAVYCLSNFRDELLDRGLDISKALAAFENELEGKGE